MRGHAAKCSLHSCRLGIFTSSLAPRNPTGLGVSPSSGAGPALMWCWLGMDCSSHIPSVANPPQLFPKFTTVGHRESFSSPPSDTAPRPRLPPCTNTKLRVLQQPPAPWSLQSVIHGASVFFEFPLSKHHTSLKKRVSSSTTSATSLLAKRGKHQTHMSAEGSNYTT